MGKNWALGLSAATDPRIAHAAAGHRGLRYRAPASGDRRLTRGAHRFSPPRTDDEWSPELAYAVGLIATDGCLSGNRKTVAQTSKDIDLLQTFNACLGKDAPIGRNSAVFRVQICDVGLYRWLESIGLTQRKSLTLGRVAVPDRVFMHFARGLLDGDGSIVYTTVVPNPSRYPLHTYPRLRVQFLSASETHILWLRTRLHELCGLQGWTTVRAAVGNRVPLYTLRYSKHESIELLGRLYEDDRAPRLERKWRIWNDFVLNARQTRIWTDRRSSRTV